MPSSQSEVQQVAASPRTEAAAMSVFSPQLRRSRPGQVQTNLTSATQNTFHMPASAISASSIASSSRPGSPIMSPDTIVMTTNSSIQASPEALRPRDEDQFSSSFQLPDSILSRKTSTRSLGHSWIGQTSPIAEASSPENRGKGLSTANPTSTTPTASSSKTNLIRRLSSRASRRLTSRRRQSSAAPISRDGSVGPCFLRRRSDSNNTAPPDYVSMPTTDSESDMEEREDFMSMRSVFLDQLQRSSSTNSTTGSISGNGNNMDGPVLPSQLQQGTWMKKISQKNKFKRLTLLYDRETNKLTWDRSHPRKFLHVDEIREIRLGTDIRQYARDFKVPDKDIPKWFSILYVMPDKSKTKLTHWVAESEETTRSWVSFLEAMLKHRQDVMTALMTFNDKAIRQFWQSEMVKRFGDQARTEDQEELDITGVMRVCQNLHIYSSQSTLQANFRLADARHREALNFEEFWDFVRLMRQRPEVQRIIRSVAAKPDKGLTVTEFLAFLRQSQFEDVDAKSAIWEKHFAKFVRKHRSDTLDDSETSDDTTYMSEAAFVGFLTSKQNGPLTEEPAEYTLDRPMNEYFISSSHNTYLLGRQVAGQSSVEGYIRALAQGCRCVEVDCWDGSDGQPQVVHGRTLTSAISFREVMTTINKYAFAKTSFPLWISLEVHCSSAQQALMVDIMKEAFGPRLVTEALDPSSDRLPSPSDLMERILIKVKKPRGSQDEGLPSADFSGRRRGSSLSSPVARPLVPDGSTFSPPPSLPQSPLLPASNQGRRLVGKSRVNTIAEGQVQQDMPCGSSNSDSESGSDAGATTRRSQNKTTKYLGALGVYCAGVKFTGFDDPAAKTFNHIFSFMESSFAKHSRTKDAKMALDIHNMRYMMRVYPDGIRLSSSNFDPLIYWRRGVQMAALNWQTFDLGLQLNQAMFQGGKDESGYVLKPAELRDIQIRPYNQDIVDGKKERSVVTFTIDVLSAQQLMRPANLAASRSMDTYVEVEVFHANDKRDKKEVGSGFTHAYDSPLKYQTEIVRENGFNPTYANGRFKFTVTTKHPELIFVRWSVKLASYGDGYSSKDSAAIAYYTAKLANLKQGFRTIPLHNHGGDQYLFSTLFCNINVDSIETKLFDIAHTPQDGGKLNRLGGKVFGRTNTSPRSTFEKGSMDKYSLEGLA